MRLLTIPTLDYLISEIDDRFTSALSSAIIQIKVLLPSTLAERTQILIAAEIPDLISLKVMIYLHLLVWKQNFTIGESNGMMQKCDSKLGAVMNIANTL